MSFGLFYEYIEQQKTVDGPWESINVFTKEKITNLQYGNSNNKISLFENIQLNSDFWEENSWRYWYCISDWRNYIVPGFMADDRVNSNQYLIYMLNTCTTKMKAEKMWHDGIIYPGQH